MYDAIAGRFLQRDAIGAGGPDGLYVYVNGSPANGLDPSGLQQLTPGDVAELLKRRLDDVSGLRGVWGVLQNLFAGRNPEDAESYKKLTKALDEIRTACKKVPALPLGLAGPCALNLAALIPRLIGEMGHQEFQVRQRASAMLAGILPFAVDAVRDALRSPDPEVSRRAEFLLEQFERACFQDRLQQAARLLTQEERRSLLAALLGQKARFTPDAGDLIDVLERMGTPKPPPPKPAPAMPPPGAAPAPPPVPPPIFA